MSWLGLPSIFEDIRPKAYTPPSGAKYSKKGKLISKGKKSWIKQARGEWAEAKTKREKRARTANVRRLARTEERKRDAEWDRKIDYKEPYLMRADIKRKRTLPKESEEWGWL